MIFGYINNLQKGESPSKYYIHHLNGLKKNNIITNIDPKLKETR